MELALTALGTLLVLCALAMYRNQWTYATRAELALTDLDAYNRLPGYFTCFFKLWIWDIKKF